MFLESKTFMGVLKTLLIWACIVFMNIFRNFVKRSLEEGGIKDGIGVSGEVRALLLSTSDLPPGSWAPTSSSCFVESNRRLIQELQLVMQDLSAIAKDKNLNVILLNGLADLLGVKFLEL